jgi:hypothetical protein
MGAKMFGVYAAEVQFRHDSAERERNLRHRMLRAERLLPEPAIRERPRVSPRAARMPAPGWPRPIAVHAGGSTGALAAYAKCD